MAEFTLFPDPGPPLVSPYPETTIEVPCATRAELYRDALEETYIVFDGYSRTRPRVRPGLMARNVYQTLAETLENYVAGGVAADINAPAYNTFFWDPTRNATTTYNRYLDLCITGGHSPGPTRPGTLSRIVHAIRYMPVVSAYPLAGVGPFYDRHHPIRDMVRTVTTNYQTAMMSACDRILADWDDLIAFFFPGRQLLRVAKIGTTGSDFHKGGQQVLLLTFHARQPLPLGSGFLARVTRSVQSTLNLAPVDELRLVYKPTDIERDCRVTGDITHLKAVYGGLSGTAQTALAGINAGPDSLFELLNVHIAPALPVYKILPCNPGSTLPTGAASSVPIRNSYGYLEFLTSDNADTHTATALDATNFYRIAGSILGALFHFGITDIHQENIIVHALQPNLIDVEMAYMGLMTDVGDTTFSNALNHHQVATNEYALHLFAGPAAVAFDRTGTQGPTKNRLYLNGARTQANAYTAQIRAGYLAVTNALINNNATFLGWIDDAQSMIVRVIPVGTDPLLRNLRELNNADRYRYTALVGLVNPNDLQQVITHYVVNQNQNLDGNWRGAMALLDATITGDPTFGGQGYQNAYRSAAYLDRAIPAFSVYAAAFAGTDFMEGDVPAYYARYDGFEMLTSAGTRVRCSLGASASVGETAVRARYAWAGLANTRMFYSALYTLHRAHLVRLGNSAAAQAHYRNFAATNPGGGIF